MKLLYWEITEVTSNKTELWKVAGCHGKSPFISRDKKELGLGPIFFQYGPEQAWLIRVLFNTQLKMFRKNATIMGWEKHAILIESQY